MDQAVADWREIKRSYSPDLYRIPLIASQSGTVNKTVTSPMAYDSSRSLSHSTFSIPQHSALRAMLAQAW